VTWTCLADGGVLACDLSRAKPRSASGGCVRGSALAACLARLEIVWTWLAVCAIHLQCLAPPGCLALFVGVRSCVSVKAT
jgi:hypothetical protein